MNLWRPVRSALNLLSSHDRRSLALLVAVQVSLSMLDLAGVALIGLVVLASTTDVQSSGSSGLAGTAMSLLPSSIFDGYGIILLALVAGLILILKSLLSFLLTRKTFRFLANRQAIIAGTLASRLLSRPLLMVQSLSSQATAATLTRSVNQMTMGVLGGAVVVASEFSLLAILTIGLAFVDATVTVFAILFFSIVALAVQRLLAHWAHKIGLRTYEAELASLTTIQEAVRSYREISVLGRRHSYITQFSEQRWQVAAAEADLRLVNIATKYIYEVALVLGGGLLALSQFLTREVASAITILAIFLVAATRLLPSVMRLQTAAFTIGAASAESQAALDLFAKLDASSDGIHEGLPIDLVSEMMSGIDSGYPGFTGELTVSSISVTYPGSPRTSLEEVSLSIGHGQSTALVGSTGAGKSTLADVILGVITPDRGSVLISGETPREAVQRWPGAIAYVPQDVTLIEGTVRENVAIGIPRLQIRDELVWNALEQSQLSNFLREQREGLDTLVGESGIRLSGGQRQRLGLARALYSSPRLLVLDEATSALDAETERLVTETVRSLNERVTTIVIAHRLATIQDCEQIVYLDEGSIRAIGTFSQVLQQVPDFMRQAKLLGLE